MRRDRDAQRYTGAANVRLVVVPDPQEPEDAVLVSKPLHAQEPAMPIGALDVHSIAWHVGQGSDFVASMRAELTDRPRERTGWRGGAI